LIKHKWDDKWLLLSRDFTKYEIIEKCSSERLFPVDLAERLFESLQSCLKIKENEDIALSIHISHYTTV